MINARTLNESECEPRLNRHFRARYQQVPDGMHQRSQHPVHLSKEMRMH